MRNWAHSVLCAVVGLVASPALSTPEQVIVIRDSLFARTDDSVLILRQFIDNQGSYYTTQTDTFVIAVSLSDGTLTDVTPIERARETHIDMPDDGTIYTPVEGAINPYALRADLGAAPMSDPAGPPFYRRAIIVPAGLIVFEGDEVRQSIPLAALTDQIITSIMTTRAALPPDDTVNGYDTLLEFFILNFMRDCTADRTVLPRNANETSSALVRLNCDDWYTDTGRNIYWVVVPPL